MNRKVALIAALLGVSAGVLPALAADQTVSTASGNRFSPATVTVTVGEQVTFTNAGGGYHNVHFDDEKFTQPPTPATSAWEHSRSFPSAGTFNYYCEPHKSVGMTGTVVVRAAATTQAATTTTTTQTQSQEQPTVGATGTPGPPASADDTTAPHMNGRLIRQRNCVGDAGPCPRTGVPMRIGVSEDATVTGELRRLVKGRFAAAGLIRFEVRQGRVTIRFRGSSHGKLTRGVHELSLVARDRAGNASTPLVLAFTLI